MQARKCLNIFPMVDASYVMVNRWLDSECQCCKFVVKDLGYAQDQSKNGFVSIFLKIFGDKKLCRLKISVVVKRSQLQFFGMTIAIFCVTVMVKDNQLWFKVYVA